MRYSNQLLDKCKDKLLQPQETDKQEKMLQITKATANTNTCKLPPQSGTSLNGGAGALRIDNTYFTVAIPGLIQIIYCMSSPFLSALLPV